MRNRLLRENRLQSKNSVEFSRFGLPVSHKTPGVKLGWWRERVLWGRTYIIGRERSLESKTSEDIVAQKRQYAKHDHCHGQEDDDVALTLGHPERIQVLVGVVDPCTLDKL